jgi:hypothetical protein
MKTQFRFALAAFSFGTAFVASPFVSTAFAEQIAREQVTLGKLADASDRIVLARVAPAPAGKVRLEIDEAVKGPKGQLDVAADADRTCCGETHVKAGDRGLFFVSGGRFHFVPVASDDDARALVSAARSRIPTLGGQTDGLRKDLLNQLGSAVKRVREDAAFDLAAMPDLAVDDAARTAFARALGTAVEAHESCVTLLGLATRAPSEAVVGPAVRAGVYAADQATLEAAARAVRAVEGGAARAGAQLVELLGGELAPQAARLLGRIGGEGVAKPLAGLLESTDAQVRRAAIDGLAHAGSADAAAALAKVAQAPRSLEEGRLALAGLALSPEGGKLLAKAAAENPDASLRRLAARLAKNPVQTAKLIEQDPSVDPAANDATPALAK